MAAAKGTKARKKTARKPAATGLQRTLWLVSSALFATMLLAQLERFVWLGALAAELGFQLMLLALLVALLALARRGFGPAGLALAAALVFSLPLVPLLRSTRPTPSVGPQLRMAHAHLAGAPFTKASLASWLIQSRIDVLAITGAPAQSASSLGRHLALYRVSTRDEDDKGAVSVLLVRDAVASTATHKSDAQPLSTRVRGGRCEVGVGVVTVPSVWSFSALEKRRRAVAALAASDKPKRSVWLGHLGSRGQARDLTPWLDALALRDARMGHGRLATRPARLGALGLPVDHAFVHGWISVRELSAGEPLVDGADRTLTLSVELTEPRCQSVRASARTGIERLP